MIADVRTQEVNLGGVRVVYQESGTGRPLVCVHGNFASKRWFTEQLKAPPEGWRVLALDLPNFGESDALEGGISIGAYADVLRGFVETLDFSAFALMGHSLGGGVAQVYAARFPDTLSALILIAAAGPSGLVTPEERYVGLEMLKDNPGLMASALEPTMPTGKPSYFDGIVEDALNMNPDAFSGNARALERYNVTSALKKVMCPVLVVRGEQDYLVSEEVARETAAAFAGVSGGARLELWEHIGHSPQIEDFERFNHLLNDFLKGAEWRRIEEDYGLR